MKNLLDLKKFEDFEDVIGKIIDAQTEITNPITKKCLEHALWVEMMYYKVESYLFDTVDVANWGSSMPGGFHVSWIDIKNDFIRNSEENIIKENLGAIQKDDLYSKEAKITLMEGYGRIPEIDKDIIEYKSVGMKHGEELFELLKDETIKLPSKLTIPQLI